MKSKLTEELEGERTFVLVFEPGEEVMAGLRAFAKEANLTTARLTAIGLNEEALARLGAPAKKLVIVAGATHLFEEPGKLEEVSRLAADWFTRYLDLPAKAKAD